jgi:hypothetical protein
LVLCVRRACESLPPSGAHDLAVGLNALARAGFRAPFESGFESRGKTEGGAAGPPGFYVDLGRALERTAAAAPPAAIVLAVSALARIGWTLSADGGPINAEGGPIKAVLAAAGRQLEEFSTTGLVTMLEALQAMGG